MRPPRILAALVALLAFAGTALADMAPVTVGDLTITDAKARPTIPNRPAAIYLTIENSGAEADRLVSAASPAFETMELHESSMTDGVMSMARVGAIDVPAGGMVMLKPGGLHLMAFGAPDPIREGEMVPVELVFERAGKVMVMVHAMKIEGGHGHSGHGHSN